MVVQDTIISLNPSEMQDFNNPEVFMNNNNCKKLYDSLKLVKSDLIKGDRVDNKGRSNWTPFTIQVDTYETLELRFPRKTTEDIKVSLTYKRNSDSIRWINQGKDKFKVDLSFIDTLKRVCKLCTGNDCEMLCTAIVSINDVCDHLVNVGLTDIITTPKVYAVGMSTIEVYFEIPNILGYYQLSFCVNKFIFSFSSRGDNNYNHILTTESISQMKETIILEVLSRVK